MSAEKSYPDRLFDLTDRVVLVTGGSRGLGREMAFAAARCGADVVIASRKFDNCVATAAAIEAETGRLEHLRSQIGAEVAGSDQ